MKRSIAVVYCSVVLATVGAAGCQTKQEKVLLPASVVNDACGTHTGAAECQTDATKGCAWVEVGSACPSGAECPAGICVTPDPCSGNESPAECGADDRCAWSALADAVETTKLCPLGQNCRDGGFCHGRDASGGGCSCVQPVACPANADCPAVQCDCAGTAPPGGDTGGSVGGGGTCTCACPACAPGESCQPCKCDCTGGDPGGSCSDGGVGSGTCTCACPSCAPGQTCPPCSCSCGGGTATTGGAGTAAESSGGTRTTTLGPSGAATPPSSQPGCICPICPADTACAPCNCPLPPADPCAAHTDATSCNADAARSCGWIELPIICMPPCVTGACVQVKPDPGGGGCGCACPACPAGQTCPPCSCTCCPGPAPSQPDGGLTPVRTPTAS